MEEKKLGVKNYAGYACIDIGGMLTFSVVGSYLSVFYTDVLGITTGAIFAIMVIARIWDAINDPLMGFLVQARKPGRSGKYRPFLLWGGIPLAFSAILMFTKIPGLSQNGYTAYAFITYVLYGMLYTVVLVPYGSLASVMSTKENERSLLSVFRSIGGGVGSVPSAILFPLLVISNNKVVGERFTLAMSIIAVVMILMYVVGFSAAKENVPSPANPEKVRILPLLRDLLRDRAFVIMSFVGCLLMASSMYLGTVNVYLFKDYFGKGSMLTILTVISYAPMALMIPFVNILIKKFGKKEISVIGLTISAVASLAICVFRVTNPWLYIAAAFFVNLGVGFSTLEVWAMTLDVIDNHEVKTGRREEAADFAVFSFMRKIGQALAALAPLIVGFAGYDSKLVGTGQNAATLNGMYTAATLVPFIMFASMLLLMILYPLNKEKTADMRVKLADRRALTEKE